MAKTFATIFRQRYLLAMCLLLMTATTVYLALNTPLHESCDCKNGDTVQRNDHVKPRNDDNGDHDISRNIVPQANEDAVKQEKVHSYEEGDNPEWGLHKLCIIIPFRSRFEELLVFVPHMHNFLNQQKVRHRILVINQADELRFNRASLINVGFLLAMDRTSNCDYIAMHDVDLIPIHPELQYPYPENGPYHVASPRLHPKYHYETFVGGILLFNNNDFMKIKGMSNRFWGWGREDDELWSRLKDVNLTIQKPTNPKLNKTNAFKHIHNKIARPRDYKRYGNQHKDSKKRDKTSGYDTVQYDIMDSYEMVIEGAPAMIYNVELKCDFKDTPWCAHAEHLSRLKAKADGTWVEPPEREVYRLGGGPNQ